MGSETEGASVARRLGFVIDTTTCYGCQACVLACKIENNVADNVRWNNLLTDGGDSPNTPSGTYPDTLHRLYYPVACQHGENPACVKGCPVGATFKDPETGAVRQDYDKCIGCRMCMSACPYNGVRSFNWEEPKYSIDHKVGGKGVPEHQKHVVEKCTMCYHRLARGEEPACVNACKIYARHWGDLNDPQSEVSQLLASRPHEQLLPERGTNPSVYYLV